MLARLAALGLHIASASFALVAGIIRLVVGLPVRKCRGVKCPYIKEGALLPAVPKTFSANIESRLVSGDGGGAIESFTSERL